MARQELAPAALLIARAVLESFPDGDVVVGCSGGADSTALALGAAWAARRKGGTVRALIVDHGLQPGSGKVAEEAAGRLERHGLSAEVVAVSVLPTGEGLEAAARDARLAALAAPGLPVLLGHTLDDQAESVLLGLLRGSGTRSLAGMAPRRGPFIRPLLGLRRADTVAACRAWGIGWWNDPMNGDFAFSRVRARDLLTQLGSGLGRDVAVALARGATLARADADLLDELAAASLAGRDPADCTALASLPDALRWRALHGWLTAAGTAAEQGHVFAVDRLVMAWRGQGPLSVPGGHVSRVGSRLVYTRGRDSG